MTKREMEEFEREGMIDSLRCRREDPTDYRAPKTSQKWRARNVISFHFRHFAYKVQPAYRDVLLCAIDHANPTTGRCDVGQRRIARECNVSRQTVNQAMRWWEENTYFLRIENRRGKTNAYHIQWDNLETDWYEIQERIHGVDLTPTRRHDVVTPEGVSAQTRHPVSAQTRQGGVNTGPTLNTKTNLKDEPQHEMARSLTANDADDDFVGNQFREIIRLPSERADGPLRLQEGESFTAEPQGLGLNWWRERANDAEAEWQQCTDAKRRKELEEKIARCRAHIEEAQHEQRAKVGAGRK